MICNRSAPLTIKPAPLNNRRSTLPRSEIAARRNEPCQHQATAEYQAARLGKLLKSQPGHTQTEIANRLLQELVEAYRLALQKARQG
ncbi:hypothetical protein I5L51_23140 [Pseudomonas mendocina]|nr:hypothetical protein [Pseudomonas mendocina]MBH3342012.1 hypothetical protein [Pseudomonas mendocina]